MAGIKIDALPAVVTPALTDVFPIDQGAVTYKESLSQVLSLFQANGSALTKTDDTNVTMNLGGSPATALLNAASMTLGWSGQLSVARGGTGLASITAHYIPIGNGTTALTLLAPNATSGIPLISQGNAADPAYGTAVVAGGGTGIATATAYSVICAGTTATGAFQSLASVGNSGEQLTSNGPGALPTWQASGAVTPAALTKADDTNVTLTLGGTPTTALLQATSITAGWTGQLSLARGGTNASLTASNGGIFYSTASAGAILGGTATASKMLLSGASSDPTWSTSTIPSSAGATANKLLLSDGTNYVLSTPTFPNASVTAGKFIISDGTNYIASTSIMPNTVGAAGKIIRSDGTVNAYTTATFPDTAGTSGNVLKSDGTNWSSAAPSTLYSAPQITVYTSGSGTYTTPAGALYLTVEMAGAGGGSGGNSSDTSATNGAPGGNSTFGTALLTCNGGALGNKSISGAGGAGGAGGTATGGDINFTGGQGQTGENFVGTAYAFQALGGNCTLFNGVQSFGSNVANVTAGTAPVANTGCGASGATGNITSVGNSGAGGAGGSLRKLITSPAASYSYGVGAGGTAGAAGTGGAAGAAGGAGIIIVTAYFQ